MPDSLSNSQTPVVRLNAGKLRLSLVPTELVDWLGEVFQMGAEKYAPWAWRENPMSRDCMEDSMLRHISAWRRGETNDAESGKHHLLHAAWNCLIQVYYEKKGLQNG